MKLIQIDYEKKTDGTVFKLETYRDTEHKARYTVHTIASEDVKAAL